MGDKVITKDGIGKLGFLCKDKIRIQVIFERREFMLIEINDITKALYQR
jgi:hypothetical protein